jgi:pSer/pThr/pTyr-binding forkhead associated (FHA) protein
MSACPRCGAAARPTDKFCNACGTPLGRISTPAAGAPGPPFGMPAAPPPIAPPQAFGAPPAPPPFAQPQAYGAPPAAPPYGASDTARDAVPPKVLRGFLISYGTNPSGDFWPLTGGRLLVGRLGSADGIDIALQDQTISSRHAAIFVDGPNGTILVEDTGSTNGTFVNDEHIGFNGRRDLRDGDRVRFGAYSTIVKVIGRV